MIFFLLRRDDSLKMGLMLALAAPLALLAHEGRIAAGALVGAAVYAALLCAIRSRLDRRATVLEMALPLAGREILAVRMIGALSIVWIPTTVAVLLLLVTHRHEVRPLLQGASILTVAALLPLTCGCGRHRSLPGYRWGYGQALPPPARHYGSLCRLPSTCRSSRRLA
jgi:hypothetical protein